MPDQFLRKLTLLVGGTPGAAAAANAQNNANPTTDNGTEVVTITAPSPMLDLSQFRVTFNVRQSDFETPNNAEITVYNLAQNTAQQIQSRWNSAAQLADQPPGTVILQAGYQSGNFGIIFQGQIKQVRIGRENQTDTYLKIFAADGDLIYTQGTVNLNIPAGTPITTQAQIIAQSTGLKADPSQINFAVGFSQANIRGKVLYGMARTYLRNIARSGQARWSIQDGQLVMTPLMAYADTEAVVINSKTGMIGVPEQTNTGIAVTCLLNPKIIPGTQIQINESSIQRAQVTAAFGPESKEAAFPAIASDGFYAVLVAEHEGDTRGNDWYSHLTCLAVDKTQPADQAVAPYG